MSNTDARGVTRAPSAQIWALPPLVGPVVVVGGVSLVVSGEHR